MLISLPLPLACGVGLQFYLFIWKFVHTFGLLKKIAGNIYNITQSSFFFLFNYMMIRKEET